jgi:hypothetical protein
VESPFLQLSEQEEASERAKRAQEVPEEPEEMVERSQQAVAPVGMPVAAESTIQAHWCSETALYSAIPLLAETALVERP